MGCLKLTYQNFESPLKVVYKKPSSRENIVQRFMSVDPLADKYPGWTPYHYVHNNPVRLVDPTGMSAEESEWEPVGKGKWKAEDGDSAWSLHKQTGITAKEANNIIQAAYGPNYLGEDGEMKSNIDPGDIVDINCAECMQVDREAKEIIDIKIDEIKHQINYKQNEVNEYRKKAELAKKEAAYHINQAGGAVRGVPDPKSHVNRNFGYGLSSLILAKWQYKKANIFNNKKDSVKTIVDSLRKELNKLK